MQKRVQKGRKGRVSFVRKWALYWADSGLRGGKIDCEKATEKLGPIVTLSRVLRRLLKRWLYCLQEVLPQDFSERNCHTLCGGASYLLLHFLLLLSSCCPILSLENSSRLTSIRVSSLVREEIYSPIWLRCLEYCFYARLESYWTGSEASRKRVSLPTRHIHRLCISSLSGSSTFVVFCFYGVVYLLKVSAFGCAATMYAADEITVTLLYILTPWKPQPSTTSA